MSRFFFFTTILILSACNQDTSATIDKSDEEVVAILHDVHLANTLVLKYRLYERDSVRLILRAQIAEIHDISVEGLDYIMEQIQLSPAKYLELEKKAVESLRAMKDSLKLTPVVKPQT